MHEEVGARGSRVLTSLTLYNPPGVVREGTIVTFTGRLVRSDTGCPIVRAVVKIFDSDITFDDLIGEGTTDQDGKFNILWKARPMDWGDRTAEVYARYERSPLYARSRAPQSGYFTILVSRYSVI